MRADACAGNVVVRRLHGALSPSRSLQGSPLLPDVSLLHVVLQADAIKQALINALTLTLRGLPHFKSSPCRLTVFYPSPSSLLRLTQ